MPNSKIDNRYDFNQNKWVISLINTTSGINGVLAGHAKIVVEGQKQPVGMGHFQPAPELCIAEFHIYDEGGAVARNNSWIPQFLKNTQSTYAVLTSIRYELKLLRAAEWDSIETPEIGDFLVRKIGDNLEYKVLEDGIVHTGFIGDTDLDPNYAPGTLMQMIEGDGLQQMKFILLNITAERRHTKPTNENDVFKAGYKLNREEQYMESSSKSWYVTPDAAMTMINDILDEKQGIGIYLGQPKSFQYAGMWCVYSYGGGHNCTTWAEKKLEKAGVGNGVILTDSSKAMPFIHVNCSLQ